jgi:hypothetical protein
MMLPSMAKDEQVRNNPQQITVQMDDKVTISSAFCSGNLSKASKSVNGVPYNVSFL